jgi:hypothetical protein
MSFAVVPGGYAFLPRLVFTERQDRLIRRWLAYTDRSGRHRRVLGYACRRRLRERAADE